MIKYSWKGGDGDNIKLDSVVTWTLEPEGQGTKLTLEHTGFKGLRNFLPYLVMGKGWLKIVKRFSKINRTRMGSSKLDVFQVIADASRRHILQLLSEQNMSINAIATNFDISRPAVSKHIKILENAGFITMTKHGRERYCMLCPEPFFELKDWLMYYDNFWKQRLQGLERLMDKDYPK